jgi:tetratricopeptide (TPR) repeat protein
LQPTSDPCPGGRTAIAVELVDDIAEISDSLRPGARSAHNYRLYQRQEHLDEAVTSYEESLPIYRELGDRHGEGQTLVNLGIVRSERGEFAIAQGCWRTAVALLEQLGAPEAATVQAWLEEQS